MFVPKQACKMICLPRRVCLICDRAPQREQRKTAGSTGPFRSAVRTAFHSILLLYFICAVGWQADQANKTML